MYRAFYDINGIRMVDESIDVYKNKVTVNGIVENPVVFSHRF